MSKMIPNTHKQLSETLSICECRKDGEGPQGFWIYDENLGFNVAMRIPDRDCAFVEVITYYQKRLKRTENELITLQQKVDNFVSQFVETSTDCEN